MPLAPFRHLPRLSEAAYRGLQFVHWTMTIAGRRQGWLTARFHDSFRERLSFVGADYDIAVPAYCLMPDHLHCLTAGLSDHSDQLLWARAFRRRLNVLLRPWRLQKQAHDHLLRPSESGPDAFLSLLEYISENPVRAGLTLDRASWPFMGSCVAGLPGLDPRTPDFSERWWAYWNRQVELPGRHAVAALQRGYGERAR